MGSDIVFGAGEWPPWTDGGKRLLAHELAHTIQQGAIFPLKRPGVQAAVASPRKVHTLTSSYAVIQRKVSLIGANIGSAQEMFDTRYFDVEEQKKPTFIVVRTKGDSPPNELTLEILWCLVRGQKEAGVTLDQLKRAVNFRKSVVESARALGKKPAQFGGFGQVNEGEVTASGNLKLEFKVNPEMWELNTPIRRGLYDVVMASLPGVKPSRAIQDIYDHPDLYAYECFSSTSFIQLHTLIQRIGSEQFNKKFRRIVLTFPSKNPAAIILQFKEFGLQEDVNASKKENDYKELVPGDQTTLQFDGFNENVIYVGQNKFFAHNKGIATVPEIAEFFKKPKLMVSRVRWRPNIDGQFL